MRRGIFAIALAAAVAASAVVGRASAVPRNDWQLRTIVRNGFTDVRDQLGSVLTCPECTEDAQALEQIAGSYMRRVRGTAASTSRGQTARAYAFYAFRGYILYGGNMALASLSSGNPDDVAYYHRLASIALKYARTKARVAANLLGLTMYP